MVTARGQGMREVEDCIGEINGGGRRFDLGWRITQDNVQMECCRIVHLKPVQFC